MQDGNMVVQFDENQAIILQGVLAYIMFAVSLEMEWNHFRWVFAKSKSLFIGLFAQLVILPLLTIGLIWVLQPTLGMALGMLLISVCPGGNVSNYAVHLSRGNTALSIVLTSISTLFAAIHIPITFLLLLHLLPHNMGSAPEISLSFFQLLKTVCILLVCPILVGMTIKSYRPVTVKKWLPFIKTSSLIFFVLIIVGALYNNWEKLPEYLRLVFWIVLLHNSIALFSGFFMAKTFKRSQEDTKAITIETGIQNSGLALVLALQFFPQIPEMSLLAAWWSIWHLISAFGLSLWWRKYYSSSTILRRSASE